MLVKLKEPDRYLLSRERMRKLIELDAPSSVIGMEAMILASCFRWTWRERLFSLYIKMPEWFIWLTWKEYRKLDYLDENVPIERDADSEGNNGHS